MGFITPRRYIQKQETFVGMVTGYIVDEDEEDQSIESTAEVQRQGPTEQYDENEEVNSDESLTED